jgi:3',5'-cyclic-AMP phosphodiesterase
MNFAKKQDRSSDGIDRRGFLRCMAWAGTGVLWTMKGGILQSAALGAEAPVEGDFSFAQVSDSHVGFNKGVYGDVVGTFRVAAERLNAMSAGPELVLHTGDLTHLSKPGEFDTVEQVMKTIRTGRSFYVPGEHDYFVDGGQEYLRRFGKGTRGSGWQSFDYKGVHFVGLVNVANLSNGKTALGVLGEEQLNWLKGDLMGRGASTPVVVFAHVPLWTVYPEWGWGTEDGGRALELLKRFGSVTVLNGHIHQVMQKVEGNVTFHTARSTAFPQPEPGKADSPGPMKGVAAERVRSMLGLTRVRYVEKGEQLAVVEETLG